MILSPSNLLPRSRCLSCAVHTVLAPCCVAKHQLPPQPYALLSLVTQPSKSVPLSILTRPLSTVCIFTLYPVSVEFSIADPLRQPCVPRKVLNLPPRVSFSLCLHHLSHAGRPGLEGHRTRHKGGSLTSSLYFVMYRQQQGNSPCLP